MAGLMDLHEVAGMYGEMARELNISGMPHDRNAQERYLLLAVGMLTGTTPAVIFVAMVAEKIVGFIQGVVEYDMYRGGMVGRCHHLFVSPEHRNQGVALKLISMLDQWGTERGAGVKEVVVHPSRQKVYERFGFKKISIVMVKGD